MKIVIDGYEANSLQRVGSSQVGFELIRNLEKLDKENNYTVVLHSQPQADLPEERDGFGYKILRPRQLWTRIALPFFLYKQKPDLVFSPTHYGPKFAPVVTKRVITIFDLAYLYFPQMFTKGDLYKLTNWTKESVEKADQIVTISKSSKIDLIKLLNVDPHKITVACPGYDNQTYRIIDDQAKIEAVKRKYEITGKYIVFLGTVQPRKNLIRLIEAVARIEELKLVIIGKAKGDKGRRSWKSEETLNRPKELGIEDRIIFTGFAPLDDIPYLFAGSVSFILPSLYEGFGIPVLEAMATGTPVIVSNVSSLPEVAGDAGLLIDPNSATQIEQAIRTVMTDNKLREKMIVKGFEQVKKFSWKKMAKIVQEVLQSTIDPQVMRESPKRRLFRQ